jgi:hypothetical protein
MSLDIYLQEPGCIYKYIKYNVCFNFEPDLSANVLKKVQIQLLTDAIIIVCNGITISGSGNSGSVWVLSKN